MIETLGFHLKPFQSPHPPIAIAAMTAGSANHRLAGAKGYIPVSFGISPDPASVASHWATVAEGAATTGRTPDRGDWRIIRDVYVAPTDAEAQALATGGVMGRCWREFLLPLYLGLGLGPLLKLRPRDAGRGRSTLDYRRRATCGSSGLAADRRGAAPRSCRRATGGFGVRCSPPPTTRPTSSAGVGGAACALLAARGAIPSVVHWNLRSPSRGNARELRRPGHRPPSTRSRASTAERPRLPRRRASGTAPTRRGRRFDLDGGHAPGESSTTRRERAPAAARAPRPTASTSSVEVDDVEATPGAGWRSTAPEPVAATSWGARLFQVRDPDGVPVTFLQWTGPGRTDGLGARDVRRIIVGISGASGAIYGIRLLEVLRGIAGIETHLVLSSGGAAHDRLETDHTVGLGRGAGRPLHRSGDIAAAISSGSFRAAGMIVAPCSMRRSRASRRRSRTTLLLRAADVILKERRRLVLLVRETPLHLGHLRLLVQVAELGAVVMPPMPAFYHRPTTLAEVVDQTVNRALDMLDVDLPSRPVRRAGRDPIRQRRAGRGPQPARRMPLSDDSPTLSPAMEIAE